MYLPQLLSICDWHRLAPHNAEHFNQLMANLATQMTQAAALLVDPTTAAGPFRTNGWGARHIQRLRLPKQSLSALG